MRLFLITPFSPFKMKCIADIPFPVVIKSDISSLRLSHHSMAQLINNFARWREKVRCYWIANVTVALLTATSPIVNNVPTRDILAFETKNSFVLWLAKFKGQKNCL